MTFYTWKRPSPLLFVREATDDQNSDQGPDSFAGAIVGGLSVFALFVLALLLIIRRYRSVHSHTADADVLHCTPFEWEPPTHPARYRYRDTAAYDHSISSTTTHPPFSRHNPIHSQSSQCWGCSPMPRGSQLPLHRVHGAASGSDNGPAMGAYHDDDVYHPSNAQRSPLPAPPAPHWIFGGNGAQVLEGSANIPEGGQSSHIPTGAHPQANTGIHSIATLNQDVSDPSSHIESPDSHMLSTHSPSINGEHRRSGYLAGRLSIILESLDSVMEEMQEEENKMNTQSGVTVAPEAQNGASFQRMKQAVELIRRESAVARGGGQASREFRDAWYPGRGEGPGETALESFSSPMHSTTPIILGAGGTVDSVGDIGMPRPWVMA